MPKTRPPYPPEFRHQMVELVRAGRSPEERALGQRRELFVQRLVELAAGQRGRDQAGAGQVDLHADPARGHVGEYRGELRPDPRPPGYRLGTRHGLNPGGPEDHHRRRAHARWASIRRAAISAAVSGRPPCAPSPAL